MRSGVQQRSGHTAGSRHLAAASYASTKAHTGRPGAPSRSGPHHTGCGSKPLWPLSHRLRPGVATPDNSGNNKRRAARQHSHRQGKDAMQARCRRGIQCRAPGAMPLQRGARQVPLPAAPPLDCERHPARLQRKGWQHTPHACPANRNKCNAWVLAPWVLGLGSWVGGWGGGLRLRAQGAHLGLGAASAPAPHTPPPHTSPPPTRLFQISSQPGSERAMARSSARPVALLRCDAMRSGRAARPDS